MVKEKFERDQRHFPVELEYDDKDFNFEYFDEKVLVRDAKSQRIIALLERIGFIIQRQIEGENHLFVSEYDENGGKYHLKDYVFYENKLLERENFETLNDYKQEINIINDTFVLYNMDRGFRLYNLRKVSPYFDKVYQYNMDDIDNIIGKKVILVSKRIKNIFYPELYDNLTFGLDPDTLEVSTPIYSELQNRTIDVYSQDNIPENLKKMSWVVDRICDNPLEATVELEVKKYLDKLGYILELEKDKTKVYHDIWKHKVNEEFVKKLKK